MKLIELHSENVKRVRAVTLRFDKSVTVIEGPNGAGKTSTIDSIWYALAGAGVHPPEVLRRGAEKGGTRLEFDDFVVERKYTPKSTSLHVTMKDGTKVASPQGFLDSLCRQAGLAFDPIGFLDLERPKQLEIVRRLAGLDFAEHDVRKQKAFDDRADKKKEGEQLAARVRAFAQEPPNLPEKPVDVDELLVEQARRQMQRQENDKLRTERQVVAHTRQAVEQALREQVDTVRRAREVLEHAEREFEIRTTRLNVQTTIDGDLSARCERLVDPNVEEITEQLRGAQAINLALVKRRERVQLEQDLAAKRAEWKKLDDQVEQLEAEKREKLRTAKFPIDGLGFGLEGLTFRDVPFEQASEAERLRTGMAIGLALNPKLKLVLIRNGSQLDSKGLELVAKLATEAEAQVIVEKVADKPGTGFFIDDGVVVEGGAS